MSFFLSKLLPLFVYPLGLGTLLLLAALFLRRRPGWRTGLTVAAFAILWLGGNRFVAMSAARSLEWRYLPPTEMPQAEVIVVLGGGERTQSYPRPIPELNEAGDRMLYAAWLYSHGAAPHLLVSSGDSDITGADDSSAGEAMANILHTMGVPDEALWVEALALNTYGNAVESRRLLSEKGIDQIILVTSALHMPRAVAVYTKQSFRVIPAPVDYFVTQADWDYYWEPNLTRQLFNLLPSAADLDLTSQVMKEYIGTLIYRIRGWL